MLALIASLSVLLTPGATSVALGDDIAVTFVVTNTGPAPFAYLERTYDRSGRIGEFQLMATRDGIPVIDPRARSPRSYVGGGVGRTATLAPGASFTQTLSLNLWALVDAPGTYTVVGRYHADGGAVDSLPVTITVTPRSAEEMGRHIARLGAALQAATTGEERQPLLRQLMFTHDARAVPFLLDARLVGGNDTFWIAEAFAHYLPNTAGVRDRVVAHVRAAGLGSITTGMLADLGVPDEAIKAVIAVSLEPARRGAWMQAALGAQRYGDDRFVARLIEIAALIRNPARDQAIYALALHRTDAGVAALKRQLADPDTRIRTLAANAIRTAYHFRGDSQGRPLRPDDFPELARK